MLKQICLIITCLGALNLFSQNENKAIKASSKKEDSSRIKIKRLKVNSENSDFCPFILNGKLFFVSSRYNELGVVYADDKNNAETTDLFYTKKIDSITFSKVKSLDGEINSKHNEGPFCFNKKGDIIYFTSNDASNLLKIFRSKKTENGWSAPEEMSFCPAGFSSCHPTLSQNEKTIIFSSDVSGGFGGMDLYQVRLENNVWTKATNLGKKINSENNEVFPFLTKDNKLYFSSNRKEGYGKLDIYFTFLDKKEKIYHPELPINSGSDDFGVFIDSSGTSGYFSSDRIAQNKDDIFYFYTWIPQLSDFNKFVAKDKFCYTFYEESVISGRDTLDLTYEWNFGDGQKARGEKIKHCYNKPGHYTVDLNIVQKVSGEVFQSQASYSLTVEEPEQISINSRDTIITGNDIVLSRSSALKKYTINKTYWSFGDGKYNEGAAVKHTYQKKGYYTVELLVEAKNQSTGKIEKLKVEKQIVVRDQKIYASK
ncbi:MAG: hypothetical protein K0S32_3204 [Bacteroidetes bacterium]|jgi:chitodextrinase|nr:hypothetical protein [Bacteroidota bacterium]